MSFSLISKDMEIEFGSNMECLQQFVNTEILISRYVAIAHCIAVTYGTMCPEASRHRDLPLEDEIRVTIKSTSPPPSPLYIYRQLNELYILFLHYQDCLARSFFQKYLN